MFSLLIYLYFLCLLNTRSVSGYGELDIMYINIKTTSTISSFTASTTKCSIILEILINSHKYEPHTLLWTNQKEMRTTSWWQHKMFFNKQRYTNKLSYSNGITAQNESLGFYFLIVKGCLPQVWNYHSLPFIYELSQPVFNLLTFTNSPLSLNFHNLPFIYELSAALYFLDTYSLIFISELSA